MSFEDVVNSTNFGGDSESDDEVYKKPPAKPIASASGTLDDSTLDDSDEEEEYKEAGAASKLSHAASAGPVIELSSDSSDSSSDSDDDGGVRHPPAAKRRRPLVDDSDGGEKLAALPSKQEVQSYWDESRAVFRENHGKSRASRSNAASVALDSFYPLPTRSTSQSAAIDGARAVSTDVFQVAVQHGCVAKHDGWESNYNHLNPNHHSLVWGGNGVECTALYQMQKRGQRGQGEVQGRRGRGKTKSLLRERGERSRRARWPSATAGRKLRRV